LPKVRVGNLSGEEEAPRHGSRSWDETRQISTICTCDNWQQFIYSI